MVEPLNKPPVRSAQSKRDARQQDVRNAQRREQQDERAFDDRPPAEKKTGEF